jgi:hypothetical protein
MQNNFFKSLFAFSLFLFATQADMNFAPAQDLTRNLDIEFKKDTFTSSDTCRKCHIDIFKYWKGSMHFLSFQDPIFITAYKQALFDTDGKAKEFCLRCHAPIADSTRDFGVKNEISKEGVSCDFCHSVSGINLEDSDRPYRVIPGKTKFGPLKNTKSPVHNTKPSDIFTKSEFCAGCHELTGNNGVSIISTYSEWKEGPYAKEGVQCQNCHMPYNKGYIVDQSLKKTVARINLHDVSGGHSLKFLKDVAKVEIIAIEKNSEEISIRVRVINAKSGHKIPTGTPTRELVLEVMLKDKKGHVISESSKVIKKVLIDEQGKELVSDNDILLKAAGLLSDNRIPPGQSREFHFSFPGNFKGEFFVDASIAYRYRPLVTTYEEMKIDISKDREKSVWR